MTIFRVVDLRSLAIEPATRVDASSPEKAAEAALGVSVGQQEGTRILACHVYWMEHGDVEMVRLYAAI